MAGETTIEILVDGSLDPFVDALAGTRRRSPSVCRNMRRVMTKKRLVLNGDWIYNEVSLYLSPLGTRTPGQAVESPATSRPLMAQGRPWRKNTPEMAWFQSPTGCARASSPLRLANVNASGWPSVHDSQPGDLGQGRVSPAAAGPRRGCASPPDISGHGKRLAISTPRSFRRSTIVSVGQHNCAALSGLDHVSRIWMRTSFRRNAASPPRCRRGWSRRRNFTAARITPQGVIMYLFGRRITA